MSDYLKKRHNVSVLLYHFVCPAKYRAIVFDIEGIDKTLKEICLEMELRYEIRFIEIGVDDDHVHFLVQGIPTDSPSKLIQRIKSITAREMFQREPRVKKVLWHSEFWTKGYFVSTVGFHGDESSIKNYIRNQGTGKNYKPLHQEELDLRSWL